MNRSMLAWLAAPLLPLACAPTPEPRDPTMQVVDSLFAGFARPGMPGASVLVMRDDTVLVQKAFGLADVEAGVVATAQTNYRLASVSKQFTAAAILLLVADGRLAVTDLASKHLPELPPHASGVTVRHLLTHTSGIRDYEDFVPDTQTYQVKDRDALDLIRTQADRLHFTPGSAWRYSNTGYALLALIVERVSGQPYGAFLQARIFDPVGMSATVAHEEGRTIVAHRAYGYRVSGDTVRRTDQSNTSAVLGDGGIYSSVVDLAKWHAALDAGDLIPRALWTEATTPFVLTDGTPTEYGYGWFIDTFEGTPRLRHHGETRGFTNIAYRFPAHRLTIVVLTNRSDAAPWDRADHLATTLLTAR
jgi:CubicO group peptidase (beta-lactamase class C family)